MGIVVLVGMQAEARLARPLRVPVLTGGGSPAGADAAARRAVADGATALISFGLAGGLDPGLRPGDLLVPGMVLHGGTAFQADAGLTARLGGATPHRLLGADAVAATVAAKRDLRQATGADALDLESGAVARIAHEHGLPFAVLRAICDPAERDLPPAALLALDRQGTVRPASVAASLLRHPVQIPRLLRLAADAAAARRSLAARVARCQGLAAWPQPPPRPAATGLRIW